MRVTEEFQHPNLANHWIQFGVSTWTENEPMSARTSSIRRAVYNQEGKFSPHGSSEMPIEDMGLFFRECVKRDLISLDELTDVLDAISSSIKRQIR